jgi:hypothetical protein
VAEAVKAPPHASTELPLHQCSGLSFHWMKESDTKV